MDGRGRKSGAALAVISGEGIVTVRRPEPPDHLTDEQAEEWRAIVNRLAADWFPTETHGLLAQYCRHLVLSKRIAQLIAAAEAAEPFDLNDYDKLLVMHEREGRALSSLATRMRLSQQSTYSKDRAKPRNTVKPWHKLKS